MSIIVAVIVCIVVSLAVMLNNREPEKPIPSQASYGEPVRTSPGISETPSAPELREARTTQSATEIPVVNKYALTIASTPSDARVKITNIKPAYYAGIALDPGDYNIEVSLKGYETYRKTVRLGDADLELPVKLTKIEVSALTQAAEISTPVTSRAAAPSNDRIKNSIGMEFVKISPGTFMMGSPSDEPGRSGWETQHRVTLSKWYYMQTSEVTQGQWKAVMGDNPSHFSSCGDNCPVEEVSWNDVQEFIRNLNAREGTNKYRLPTEAEWEYACRAGSSTAYYYGDSESDLSRYAWYDSNSGSKTHPVGQKQPNAWGLYDMHGNVGEWCADLKAEYPSGSVTDPEGPSSGHIRVMRAGSWSINARYCRSACRDINVADDSRGGDLGFRLVLLPGQ